MWFEGDDAKWGVEFTGSGAGQRDDGLVAKVDAVKIAKCDGCALVFGRNSRVGLVAFHRNLPIAWVTDN